MKRLSIYIILFSTFSVNVFAQDNTINPKKFGAEINVLWPIFPGNIYKGQVTYEMWRKNHLAGDVYVGFHIRPFGYRETEGDFSNYALIFGYRQFIWKGLHADLYQAYGPGFNRNNIVDGRLGL